MQMNAIFAFSILTTLAITPLAFIANRKSRPAAAAFLAAVAWCLLSVPHHFGVKVSLPAVVCQALLKSQPT